ncbi:Mitochondrial DNA replication protein yhm2 [Phlyctochytrium bullatum]|nr:Mitochondrial DNA replication protein yhm2 [Phlyctochytrium bullatum]
MAIDTTPVDPNAPLKKKPISFVNLAIGAGLNLFEVTTLGQPFEVIKTQMAANRGQSMPTAIAHIWSRGGILAYYQGLIPWAWIEAATKGAVLLFAASEFEYQIRVLGGSPAVAGILGGMGGGIAQAYTTMGFCTFMKTVEVTRHKGEGVNKSTIQVAREIFAREGIRGINKGVNAVALRQMTNWGSRFGLSRIAEDAIKNRPGRDKNQKLSGIERVVASSIGGGLSCWNQPIEVIRVEMQSQVKAEGRPEKMTIGSAASYIYKNNGILGFYRGVTPRVCLGMWQTICMVAFGDSKAFVTEEVNNIVKESIENTIQNAAYHHNKVGQWNSNIVELCLKKLTQLNKPFKYIVTCTIMQKNGAGLHAASSCYWDAATDGCTTYKYDSKTMYCIGSLSQAMNVY